LQYHKASPMMQRAYLYSLLTPSGSHISSWWKKS